jgi:hypothetical protein
LFRDHENRYLVASVGLVLVLTALVAVYETAFKTDDSAIETILAIAQGVSSAVAIAVTAIALWEVLVIFAEKYKARRYEEGRQEGRKEGQRQERRAWEEWNARRLEALERGEPFDEPTPSSWEDMK